MNKELTLKEAENIVDNMYQNRWKECGVEDGNTIHLGNLGNLKYNELESASILLLRTEIRLQKENKKYKEVIDKATKNEEEIMYLANKVAITTQNVEIKAVRDRLEEIYKDILKEV